MVFFYPPLHAKLATLVLIALVATGTKAKEKKILILQRNNYSYYYRPWNDPGILALVNNTGNNSLPKVLPKD